MIATQTNNEQDLEFIERAKLHKIKFYEVLEAQRLQEDLTRNNDPASGSKRLYSNSEYLNLIKKFTKLKRRLGQKQIGNIIFSMHMKYMRLTRW